MIEHIKRKLIRKRYLIIHTLMALLLDSGLRSQSLYSNNELEISAVFLPNEGLILFKLHNLTESDILLNERNFIVDKLDEKRWYIDLSLVSLGVGALNEPSYGTYLSFRRLYGNTENIIVAFDLPHAIEIETTTLIFQMDYILLPMDLVLIDKMQYREFLRVINASGLEVERVKIELKFEKQDFENKFCQSWFIKLK